MKGQGSRTSEEESIKAKVYEGFHEAKQFAKTLDFEEVKSGEWFVKLLQKVIYAYDRNARAEYFQKKYPGLPPDDIADILISVTSRYAAVAGGIAGAAATTSQIATLSTAGMTLPLFLGVIGGEMIYLSKIQLRLVLDLSVVYDLQLDPEDPEDVLMVFGYALGVAPAEVIGTLTLQAARGGTKTLVKRYISKQVLKAIQDFARKLGFKILQRTILKYTVPVVSAAVGSSYNYASTRVLGGIAKIHFKSRAKVTAELRALLSRKYTYNLVFPAAALYVANLDGEPSSTERELYRAMLSRMTFPEHGPAEFEELLDAEENLIEAAANIESYQMRRTLIDVVVLMAVCDGELSEKERAFLSSIAGRLNVPLDLNDAERRTRDYRIPVGEKAPMRVARAVADSAATTGSMVKDRLNTILGRNRPKQEGSGAWSEEA